MSLPVGARRRNLPDRRCDVLWAATASIALIEVNAAASTFRQTNRQCLGFEGQCGVIYHLPDHARSFRADRITQHSQCVGAFVLTLCLHWLVSGT
jgi:hypothetical protein